MLRYNAFRVWNSWALNVGKTLPPYPFKMVISPSSFVYSSSLCPKFTENRPKRDSPKKLRKCISYVSQAVARKFWNQVKDKNLNLEKNWDWKINDKERTLKDGNKRKENIKELEKWGFRRGPTLLSRMPFAAP